MICIFFLDISFMVMADLRNLTDTLTKSLLTITYVLLQRCIEFEVKFVVLIVFVDQHIA